MNDENEDDTVNIAYVMNAARTLAIMSPEEATEKAERLIAAVDAERDAGRISIDQYAAARSAIGRNSARCLERRCGWPGI